MSKVDYRNKVLLDILLTPNFWMVIQYFFFFYLWSA